MIINKLAIALIKAYQFLLSPIIGNQCRFYPSCSSYALSTYQQTNFFKATYLTIKRLLRCQPFSPGGIDYPKLNATKKDERI